MIMKRAALSIFIVFILFSTSSSRPPADTSPEEITRQFYAWYLHRLNVNDSNPLKNRTQALKYLTPEYLRRAPKLAQQRDADVIICAQDFDKDWEKNIKVAEPKIDGDRATTMVDLTGKEMSDKLKVGLKHTSAGWRIDSVTCTE